MTKRLQSIFSVIPKCKKFADVGCDHGYISLKMLQENKCDFVVYSDVSEPSLNKAKKLLENYTDKSKSVCCNGLEKIDTDCDCVLIAGMGGENIISILQNSPFLPYSLVLQPMKNVDKLRSFLCKTGYKILLDKKFYAEQKYYDVIYLVKGEDKLSEQEIIYGRTNLTEPKKDFLNFLLLQIRKNEGILSGLPQEKKQALAKKIDEEKNLYGRLRTKAKT